MTHQITVEEAEKVLAGINLTIASEYNCDYCKTLEIMPCRDFIYVVNKNRKPVEITKSLEKAVKVYNRL